MKKSTIIIVIIALVATFIPTRVSAFEASKPEVIVTHELSYNDDKGNGKYKGFSSEYVLQKYISIYGTIELAEKEGTTWVPDVNRYPDASENESLVKVNIYINGNAYEAETFDTEYRFQPGFFEFMTEWSLDSKRTDNDHIRVVVTSQNKEGNIVQEKEVYNQTFTQTIPTAADFCKSKNSYKNVFAPMSLCDEIKNEQIEKNEEKIQDNKKEIDQNKEDIKDNKENIEENNDNIEQNKEDINQNKEEIEAVKEEVEEVKETVLALQSQVNGLEAKVKEVIDEVNGLKNYILSFSEINSDRDGEFKPLELWYREIAEEEEEKMEEDQLSFLQRKFFGSTVHAAETEWYREKWDASSELTFEEGINYEVLLVSESEIGTKNIEGFHFSATSDGLETEQTDAKGPFEEEELDEDPTEIEEVAATELEDEKSANFITIFSLIIGVIGVLVLGVVIGVYFTKRKEIHQFFKKG